MLEIRGENLEVGVVVGARYRLERIVGEGGMGVVWAAREVATGRRVALKLLREGRETDVRNQERVLREARAVMAISHANVAKIEAVLETDAGVPFLVMELLEGESLRDLLRRRHVLTPLECARILVPVVDAVLAAHASHIVHRDLKPENVFLGKDERVRVLDFGIAKQLPKGGAAAAESLTSTGALLGTPIYMAPEQIFGDDDIDGAADVWSLGILLYECLAGKRPTDGEGFGPIIKRITTGTLEPLEHAREGLPRRLTSLVGRMLARERTLRPALVEVRAILASIVDAGEGAAPSERAPDVELRALPMLPASTTGAVASRRALTDPAERTPPRGRRLALIGGALGVVGVVGVLAGVEIWRGGRAQPPPPLAAQETTKRAEQGSTLLHQIAQLHATRDGAACTRDLDRYDRDFAPAATMLVSTDPASGNAGLRAMCLMTAGRCSEGATLYRAWVEPYVLDGGGALVDPTVESIVTNYCEGPELSPPLALVRANQRLRLWGAFPGAYPDPTVSGCRAWAEDERRLRPLVGSNAPAAVDYRDPLEERLAKCLERASAPRDH